jgi:hypothetical protein
MQAIQILLAPDLSVDALAFVQAWNATAPAQDLPPAEAVVPKGALEAFPLDPHIQQALIYLAGAVTPLALDIAKEVLKAVISKLLTDAAGRAQSHASPSIQVEKITQPDGAVLLVVHEHKR